MTPCSNGNRGVLGGQGSWLGDTTSSDKLLSYPRGWTTSYPLILVGSEILGWVGRMQPDGPARVKLAYDCRIGLAATSHMPYFQAGPSTCGHIQVSVRRLP